MEEEKVVKKFSLVKLVLVLLIQISKEDIQNEIRSKNEENKK